MKTKYFKSSLLLTVCTMLFAACDSDRDDNPQLGPNHTASEFVVNTSAVADQYTPLKINVFSSWELRLMREQKRAMAKACLGCNIP